MVNEKQGHTVLVVEDEEHIAQILEFMLKREGFEVVLATDGRRAREWMGENPPPHLVLLDIMLPYADGFEIIGELRRLPGWERVPVIMLTAKSQERDIVRALDAGANDYVLKPFNPAELMARLRRYLIAA